MYQSSTYKYIDYNNKTYECIYEVTTIDSNFTETIKVGVHAGSDAAAGAAAIIQIYSKRKLNVAKNLFPYMKWIENESSWYTFKKQIKDYSQYVPEFKFKQYLPELNKYLILS